MTSRVFFNLLHFFVGEIDDELFEAVSLGGAGFEAVHVEDAHGAMLARGLDLKQKKIPMTSRDPDLKSTFKHSKNIISNGTECVTDFN